MYEDSGELPTPGENNQAGDGLLTLTSYRDRGRKEGRREGKGNKKRKISQKDKEEEKSSSQVEKKKIGETPQSTSPYGNESMKITADQRKS